MIAVLALLGATSAINVDRWESDKSPPQGQNAPTPSGQSRW